MASSWQRTHESRGNGSRQCAGLFSRQQQFHIQKTRHGLNRTRFDLAEAKLAVHSESGPHSWRMSVQPKPRAAKRSSFLNGSLYKIFSNLSAAKRRAHIEVLHLACTLQREGTQSDTAYRLSCYGGQKQLALGRSVNSRKLRKLGFQRLGAVLGHQLSLILTKEIANLLQLLLAYRFRNLAQAAPSFFKPNRGFSRNCGFSEDARPASWLAVSTEISSMNTPLRSVFIRG